MTILSTNTPTDAQPNDPLREQLAVDDVTMLAFAAIAMLGAAVLLGLGF